MLGFFGWFQLAGLALFLGVFLGRTLYLHIHRRINAITLNIGRKGWRGLVELFLFTLVNVWAVEVSLYAFQAPWRLFPAPLHTVLLDSLPTRMLGVTLVVGGLFLFTWAIRDLGPSWRLGIDEQRPGRLVTRGIYALSRHPIYLFFNLYFVGTFLINGTLIFLLFALLAAANLHLQILIEEAFLLQVYGQDYRLYCLRTWRYLGWRGVRPRAAPTGSED